MDAPPNKDRQHRKGYSRAAPHQSAVGALAHRVQPLGVDPEALGRLQKLIRVEDAAVAGAGRRDGSRGRHVCNGEGLAAVRKKALEPGDRCDGHHAARVVAAARAPARAGCRAGS
eukprot:354058-Chlamydomonas_euryale.AAC.10